MSLRRPCPFANRLGIVASSSLIRRCLCGGKKSYLFESHTLLKGTHLLDVAAGKKIFKQGGGLNSLYGSTKNADDFNVANAVYKEAQKVDSYIDPSLTMAVK